MEINKAFDSDEEFSAAKRRVETVETTEEVEQIEPSADNTEQKTESAREVELES